MAPRTLYHTPLSPFSRKIRVLLKEKELEFEQVSEPPLDYSAKVHALNPAGELPVLVDEDGTIICGHYAISEYIDDSATSNYMLGNTLKERAEVRRLVDWFDSKFYREVSGPILGEKYVKTIMRHGQPHTDVIRAAQKSILLHLDAIGKLHSRNKWLAGEWFSLADITAAVHLSCVDYFGDIPWEHNVDAKEWYALVKSRPAFRTVLADRVSAFRPPEHYENPDF